MIPGSFDYVAAKSVPEAIALLEQYGDEAKILAGGHSLIPLLRFRLAAPSILVDINPIHALENLHETDNVLHIGALVREADLEHSDLIRTRYPLLLDTSIGVADPVVRNWATVGGNLAHADPANDHPAAMLALGASVVAVGPLGERVIPIDEFFTDAPFETTLQQHELLSEVRIPAPTERSGGAYMKLERKVGDYAIAGVAAYVTLDGDGLVSHAGIGLTNVGSHPIRAHDAELALLGAPLNDISISHAAELAARAAQPTSDDRGPAAYKRAMIRTLCARALNKALERAS
ncbi:MAG TPA: xanthine dehydrogenase family protein subunit M [Ktedonobacteraceae bacterium]